MRDPARHIVVFVVGSGSSSGRQGARPGIQIDFRFRTLGPCFAIASLAHSTDDVLLQRVPEDSPSNLENAHLQDTLDIVSTRLRSVRPLF